MPFCELSKRIINKVFEDIKNSSKKASINLTYEDIYDEATRRLIKIFIKKYKDIKNIEFEIAEVEILKNYELVEAFINEVADLGASFCIDNFGATHSSFALLRSLKNIQSIKINNELTKNYKFNIAFLEAIVISACVVFVNTMFIELGDITMADITTKTILYLSVYVYSVKALANLTKLFPSWTIINVLHDVLTTAVLAKLKDRIGITNNKTKIDEL